MSTIDFYASPHRPELGHELRQAFRELNLDGVEEAAPTDDAALLGVRLRNALTEHEVEAQAEELRIALAALLTGGPIVSFKLAS